MKLEFQDVKVNLKEQLYYISTCADNLLVANKESQKIMSSLSNERKDARSIMSEGCKKITETLALHY